MPSLPAPVPQHSLKFLPSTYSESSYTTAPTSSFLDKIAPFTRGIVAGLIGRVCINNFVDMTAAYQNNKGLSLSNTSLCATRGMLMGSAFQASFAFGTHAVFINPSDSIAESTIKNAFSGILAGLVMHPSAVNFFYTNNHKSCKNSPIYYSLEFLKLCIENPKIFYRGISLRCAMSGVEWSTYFTCKDVLQKRGYESDTSLHLAAITAILASTPLYQKYIDRIQNGNIANNGNIASKGVIVKIGTSAHTTLGCLSRNIRAFGLFSGLSVAEKYICEKTTDFMRAK
ncbi:MAG: hypothetical protein V4629_04360 [Pseudomonadota bacterium]